MQNALTCIRLAESAFASSRDQSIRSAKDNEIQLPLTSVLVGSMCSRQPLQVLPLAASALRVESSGAKDAGLCWRDCEASICINNAAPVHSGIQILGASCLLLFQILPRVLCAL